MSFTSAWQSSKLPSTAMACTLAALDVVICRCCTGETRPSGNRMKMSVRSRPAKASIAAPPVSPEVAPTIVARRPCSASTWSIRPREQLHRHVLEGKRRAVEQLQHEAVGIDLHQRADGRVVEAGIGLAHDPRESGAADLAAEVGRQHPDRQLRIGKPAHGADVGGRKKRPFGRHVEAAVAGEPGQQRIREAEDGRFAARAQISHVHLSVTAARKPRRCAEKRNCLSRIFAAALL